MTEEASKETPVETITPKVDGTPKATTADDKAAAVFEKHFEDKGTTQPDQPQKDVTNVPDKGDEKPVEDKPEEDKPVVLTKNQRLGADYLKIKPEDVGNFDPAVLERAGKQRSDLSRQARGLKPKYVDKPGTESQPEELEVISDDILEQLESEDGEAVKQQVGKLNQKIAKLETDAKIKESKEIETTFDAFFDSLNEEDFAAFAPGLSDSLEEGGSELELRRDVYFSAAAFRDAYMERTGKELPWDQAQKKALIDVVPELVTASEKRNLTTKTRKQNKGSMPPTNTKASTAPKAAEGDDAAVAIWENYQKSN